MNRIALWRLRALLKTNLYRKEIVVEASILGGWFVARPRHLVRSYPATVSL